MMNTNSVPPMTNYRVVEGEFSGTTDVVRPLVEPHHAFKPYCEGSNYCAAKGVKQKFCSLPPAAEIHQVAEPQGEQVEPCVNCGHGLVHDKPCGTVADCCPFPGCDCGYYAAPDPEPVTAGPTHSDSHCAHCDKDFVSVGAPGAALCAPCFMAGHRGFVCSKYCVVSGASLERAQQWARDYAANPDTNPRYQRTVAHVVAEEPVRCPECGHKPHTPGGCLNIASDSDCNCTSGEVAHPPDAEQTAYELIAVIHELLPRGSMDGHVRHIREEIQKHIQRELDRARPATPSVEGWENMAVRRLADIGWLCGEEGEPLSNEEEEKAARVIRETHDSRVAQLESALRECVKQMESAAPLLEMFPDDYGDALNAARRVLEGEGK